MRETKYRFYDKIKKEMIYPKDIWEMGMFFSTITDDWEALEFTGLMDRSGKEIFEGDILKNENHDELMATKKDKIIVEWSELGFYKNFNLYNDSEVIGNIYEGVLPIYQNNDILKVCQKELRVSKKDTQQVKPVSYTHLTLPTNREV